MITIGPSDDEALVSISTQLIESETSTQGPGRPNPNTADTVAEGHAPEGDTDDTQGTRDKSSK